MKDFESTFKSKLKYIPLNVLTSSREGAKVLKDRWWALSSAGEAIVYQERFPQCNPRKEIAEYLSNKMYSGKVIFIETAFI